MASLIARLDSQIPELKQLKQLKEQTQAGAGAAATGTSD